MSNARNLGDFAPYTSSGATQPVLSLPNLGETTTVSATAATGTINYDVINQSVLYYTTDASANWTLNLRGDSSTTFASFISVGQAVEIKFLVTNGATAYAPTAFQIDGSSVTVKWAGGTAPSSGTANAVDEYAYTVICTGAGTYTVYGQRATSTAAASSGGGGGFSNMDVLTSGTSWTAPAGVTKIKVYATGGGGGASVTYSGSSTWWQGASGAGGGTAIKIFTVVPSTSYTYAIGTGGTSPSTAATNGNAGGNTTFTVGGTTITGGGGAGGNVTDALSSQGSNGGSATNGDLNLVGGGGSPRNANANPDGSYAPGIAGGTFWGPGPTCSTSNAGSSTPISSVYGAGGVGYAFFSSSAQFSAGYNGKQGVIVIEY